MSVLKQGNVKKNIDDKGIATIEFYHPMSNSLPGKLLAKLADTITATGNNESVKVIVLKSSGDRTFLSLIHISEPTRL